MANRGYTDAENTWLKREVRSAELKTIVDRRRFAKAFNENFGNPDRTPSALRTQLNRLAAESGEGRVAGVRDFTRIRELLGRIEKRYARAQRKKPARKPAATTAKRQAIVQLRKENHELRKANRELERKLNQTTRQLASFLKAMSRAQGALAVHSRGSR